MSKLSEEWLNAFQCCFSTEEDVAEFIIEHLDTSEFESSFVDMGGYHEPNESFEITADDKRRNLSDFLIYLINRKDELISEVDRLRAEVEKHKGRENELMGVLDQIDDAIFDQALKQYHSKVGETDA